MNYFLPIVVVLISILSVVIGQKCDLYCPPGQGPVVCGIDTSTAKYTMYPNECTLQAQVLCYKRHVTKTALSYCINNIMTNTRRMYGDSCPVFCPAHYRPVCGMSTLRTYIYKTFNNGCWLDMINCRGDELNSYVEVPLSMCQRHLMKNIFKENIVFSGHHDYRDYHED